MALTAFSEPFSGSGGASASSQIRAFEPNDLSTREAFLRETVQNAWDARLSEGSSGSIDFSVEWRRVEPAQRAILCDEVFTSVPAEHPGLRSALTRQTLDMIVVSDRGTRGLGGPTNAAVEPERGSKTDYRDFVLDLGREDDKQIGGGTYGIGKAVWFTVSAARTLLIYTQTIVRGRVEPRLIAVASGKAFPRGGQRYTGRHRWGVPTSAAENSIVDPLRNHAARDLALRLGLTELAKDETGTSIAVLDPELFEEETPESAMRATAHAALRWTWPHLVQEDHAGRRAPSIRYRFRAFDEEVLVPDPLSHPETRAFAQAYSLLDEMRKSTEIDTKLVHYETVDMQRPKRRLGELIQVQAVRATDHDHFSGATIALMRKPRFIVKYWTVAVPSSEFEAFGVFVADSDDAVDAIFAKSEPVAHNDWIPEKVKERGKSNPVKLALDKIKESVKRVNGQSQSDRAGAQHSGLPRLAREFAAVLSGGAGVGATRRTASGQRRNPSKPRGAVSVRLSEHVEYVEVGGRELAEFQFTVLGAVEHLSQYEFVAVPWIELGDGSRESEPPTGEAVPEIHSWSVDSGSTPFATGDRAGGGLLPQVSGVVRVALPDAAAVGLRIDTIKLQDASA